MDNQKRVEILMAAISDSLVLQAEERQAVEFALYEGISHIIKLEHEEKIALDPVKLFEVEKVLEGFGFWNRGGFDRQINRGQALVAAGRDGNKLKIIRAMKERNGRHLLGVLYPGCYIAEAFSVDQIGMPTVSVYQVERFVLFEGKSMAEGRRIYRSQPHLCKIPKEEFLYNLIGITGDLAIAANAYDVY